MYKFLDDKSICAFFYFNKGKGDKRNERNYKKQTIK